MTQSISPSGGNGSNPMVTITTGNNDTKDSFLSWDSACDKNSQCGNSDTTRKVVWSKSASGNNNGQTWTATTQSTTGGTDSKVVDRVELFFGDNTPSFHLGDRIHPFNPMHAHSIYKKLSSYRI